MLDPSLCRCAGLFRHIRKQDHIHQSSVPLELDYHGEPGKVIQFRSLALLGGFDLAVLHAVLSIGRRASSNDSSQEMVNSKLDKAELLSRLWTSSRPEPCDGLEDQDMLTFGFSFQMLLQVAGLQENGRNSLAARESLRRLENVTMTVEDCSSGVRGHPARLLAMYWPTGTADKGFRVWAAINSRLTGYLLRKEHQHIRISLDEGRKLKDNLAARVLHQRLSAVIDDDDERSLKMSTILGYLYPEDSFTMAFEEARANTIASFAKLRSRPKNLQQAKIDDTIDAIEVIQTVLKWDISLVRNKGHALDALWRIRRPKVNRTKHEVHLLRAQSKNV